MTKDSQQQRIFDRLKLGRRVPLPELHRIGSGKEHGFVGSFTRRISDIRKAGYTVICHKSTQPDGTVFSEYELIGGQ